MFNRYLSEDREAFEDLYQPVSDEPKQTELPPPAEEKPARRPGKLKFDEKGLFPLVLLFLLVQDVDEEEKWMIFLLAAVLGI